jgi:3-hydroxyacyl-[acyl-carrier-protein] dehydratase
MLMIDRVLECEPGKRIVALKNVSINEPFFPGISRHADPARRADPGSDGAGGRPARVQHDGHQADGQSLYYFAGIDNARFKRPVKPATS